MCRGGLATALREDTSGTRKKNDVFGQKFTSVPTIHNDQKGNQLVRCVAYSPDNVWRGLAPGCFGEVCRGLICHTQMRFRHCLRERSKCHDSFFSSGRWIVKFIHFLSELSDFCQPCVVLPVALANRSSSFRVGSRYLGVIITKTLGKFETTRKFRFWCKGYRGANLRAVGKRLAIKTPQVHSL